MYFKFLLSHLNRSYRQTAVFIYFKGKSGDLCKLTPHTIAKISEYCKKWNDLDGEQSTVAANVAERIKRWSFKSETSAR